MGQVTSAGYVVTTEAEYIAAGRSAFEAEFGVSVDWTSARVINELFSLHASGLADLDMAVKAIKDQASPNDAAGLALADIGAMRGISPDPGSYSTGTVTVTAWSGGSVVIPSGYDMQAGGTSGGLATRGDRWVTTADVTVSAGGSATVAVRSKNRGAYGMNTTDLLRPSGNSGVSGVVSLQGASTATLGTAPDTAASFRKTLNARSQFGSRSADAIATAIREVPGVEACLVFDNDGLTTTVVSGVTLPPGSMCAIVHPSTIDTEAKKQVASLLYGMAPTGIKVVYPSTTGSSGAKYSTVGGDGLTKYTGWYWSVANPVAVTLSVTAFDEGYVLADVSAAATEAIEAYFAALTIGQTVRRLDLLAALAAVPGIAAVSLTAPASDTTSTNVQYPTAGTITVT